MPHTIALPLLINEVTAGVSSGGSTTNDTRLTLHD